MKKSTQAKSSTVSNVGADLFIEVLQDDTANRNVQDRAIVRNFVAHLSAVPRKEFAIMLNRLLAIDTDRGIRCASRCLENINGVKD